MYPRRKENCNKASNYSKKKKKPNAQKTYSTNLVMGFKNLLIFSVIINNKKFSKGI